MASFFLRINLFLGVDIFFILFSFCCMSAFQSPMRMHGDNIYVRHSNLMLEVGTGTRLMAANKEYMSLCTLDAIRTAAPRVQCCTRPLPSRTLRLCACLRVFVCADCLQIKVSTLSFTYFSSCGLESFLC